MSTNALISFSSVPEISAIYYALLQCGYDYYAIERNEEHIDTIHKYIVQDDIPAFFSSVKQKSCIVYPYWPRAAMLETASFYLNGNHKSFHNFDLLRNTIMAASNLNDNERDQAFWTWILDFPAAINAVLKDKHFHSYMSWEKSWCSDFQASYKDELYHLQSCIETCLNIYASQIQQIQLVINPIKCALSADYHLVESKLIFTSGSFHVDSVIHECLHYILHPFICNQKAFILKQKAIFSELDPSYYLSGDNVGMLNAFEEHAVRELTKSILSQNYPNDLTKFIETLLRQNK